MTKLRCTGVCKAYGRRAALDDVSLSVDAGQWVAIVGPSGAGKTTLLHLIAGLDRVDEGRIEIDGRPVSLPRGHVPPSERGVAMVFQDRALWTHLTAQQHFHMVTRGRNSGADLLDRLGMASLLDRRPDEMSGGEAQRLAVALAVASGRHLLLLDEPRSQIDPTSLARIDELLDELAREGDVACVFVTHDAEEASRWADRVVMLDEARVRQVGAFAELYQRPRSATIARQTGPVSLIGGVLTGPGTARTSLGELPVESDVALGEQVVLAARPEDWCCFDEGESTGRAVRSHHSRGRWLARIDCNGEQVLAYLESRPTPGDAVCIKPARAIWAFRDIQPGLETGAGAAIRPGVPQTRDKPAADAGGVGGGC